jgi:hypothetical protein
MTKKSYDYNFFDILKSDMKLSLWEQLTNLFYILLVYFIAILIIGSLVQYIWNLALLKFNSNYEKLTYWEGVAIATFIVFTR